VSDIKQKTGTINHGIARYTDKDGIFRLAYRGDIVTMPEHEYDRLNEHDVFGDARLPEVYRREKQGLSTDPASAPITTPIAGVSSTASARMAALREQHTNPGDDIDDLSEQVDPSLVEAPKSSPFEAVEQETQPVAKPIHVAPKADWVNYAANGAPEALRISFEEADLMTKQALIARFSQR